MNHEILFRDLGDRCFGFALTGAKGGFSRTLLAQIRAIPRLRPAALCDLDPEGVLALLAELGFPADAARICETPDSAREAAATGHIVVLRDQSLLGAVPHDILVEATGQPEAGARMALEAIRRGAHVAMVSKEVDSVVGPHLNRLACDRGLVYTTADGDQPSNLIGLVTWARLLGFEVVAAGKSSEYDFVFDHATGTVTCADLRGEAPALADLWALGEDVTGTLARRSAALADLPQSATPDYCEMNVVANSTGLLPSRPELSYPLCRITELADVFIPREDGGILDRTGVVDVFNCLRRPEEVSFGGGVFVVVRAGDRPVWEMLRGKGHLVSRNGRYACIFLPYHFMGLETPVSLLSAAGHGRASGSDRQRVEAVMVARAERDFRAGEVLEMGGHHHIMTDCTPLLLPVAEARGLAPFYLAANKPLRVDVPRGTLIREEMVDLEGSLLQSLRQEDVVPAAG
ncbi:homoserine dehydrogenase [Roseomonas gilardii subsp. gilardii]|uniref:NAD(P)H-dependent oxidoreductase n=1 Tax=Roseomonas gilardii TaxID=257708 RepID=UPI001FF91F62|nr:homoserine dehydrogenase [Roseomonas gilardii]UPG73455.1 homoserine dehydrogenase [Roseomonas gilardii subsp. gilardii]